MGRAPPTPRGHKRTPSGQSLLPGAACSSPPKAGPSLYFSPRVFPGEDGLRPAQAALQRGGFVLCYPWKCTFPSLAASPATRGLSAAGGRDRPSLGGGLRGVTAGCLYKPTGTSPASDTSLPAAPGCNPPCSSDVTGGGRVQPPPSPFSDSKCLILRGSQTNKCNFSHFGAWPAAPLGALPTAAPHLLPPSRVRLCRQTSHLSQIFHLKMSLLLPRRMTRRRRSYGAQLTVLTRQVPLPGRAMLSAAVGAAPHAVPQHLPVPGSHASMPVVPEAFVDALQTFQGR